MSDKPFVDTNILVYAVESSIESAAKSRKAKALLSAGGFCLSTQVLASFIGR